MEIQGGLIIFGSNKCLSIVKETVNETKLFYISNVSQNRYVIEFMKWMRTFEGGSTNEYYTASKIEINWLPSAEKPKIRLK